VAADALEQSVLESKDKDQLVAIATALGLKSVARSKKEDIIKKILDTVGPSAGPSEEPVAAAPVKRGPGRPRKDAGVVPPPPTDTAPAPAPAADVVLGPDGEPLAEWEAELVRQGISTATEEVGADGASQGDRGPRGDRGDRGDRGQQGDRGDRGDRGPRQFNDRQNGGQRNFDRNDRNNDRFEG
jgi:hypothetical protein